MASVNKLGRGTAAYDRFNEMIRYFITGAQGFLGRYLVSHLLDNPDAEVLGIGRSPVSAATFSHSVGLRICRIPAPLPTELTTALGRRYHYVSVDLRDQVRLTHILSDFQPHFIFHLASGLRDDPLAHLIGANIEGTASLLEALAASGTRVQKLVLASTGGVYGVPAALPILETAVCNPVDAYSATKLAAEHLSRILADRYRIPAVWARLFNLLGPGQDERHICGKLLAELTAPSEDRAQRVIHMGTLQTTRDFIDVRDAACALRLLAETAEVCTYNVASGTETQMASLVNMAIEACGLNGCVEIDSRGCRTFDIPRHYASKVRLHAIGFRCRFEVSQSLSDIVTYYRRLVWKNL